MSAFQLISAFFPAGICTLYLFSAQFWVALTNFTLFFNHFDNFQLFQQFFNFHAWNQSMGTIEIVCFQCQEIFEYPFKSVNFFSYSFTTTATGCWHSFYGSTGTITSPNYPKKYSNRQYCFYFIKIPTAHTVDITFTSFETEVHKDTLELNIGPVADYTLPDTRIFDGDELPGDIRLNNTNQFFMIWSTDVNIVKKGWQLTYTSGKY